MAPEFYDHLLYHSSYVKRWFTFLFSQEVGFFSRILRKERGNVGLADNSTPDIQIMAAKKEVYTFHSTGFYGHAIPIESFSICLKKYPNA